MDEFRKEGEQGIRNMDFRNRKTVVLDRDIYEEKDGMKVLVARRGERVTPETAKKYGVIPISSASGPVLESKVTMIKPQRDPMVKLARK